MRKISIILTIAFLLTGFISNTNAQILIMDDENLENRLGNNTEENFVIPGIMPDHDTTWDYTPIGDGLWVLGCLGCAYLMQKKRKKDQ